MEVIIEATNIKAKKKIIVLSVVKSPERAKGKARTTRNKSSKNRIKRGVTPQKDKGSSGKSKTNEYKNNRQGGEKSEISNKVTTMDKSTKITKKKINKTKKVKAASGKQIST